VSGCRDASIFNNDIVLGANRHEGPQRHFEIVRRTHVLDEQFQKFNMVEEPLGGALFRRIHLQELHVAAPSSVFFPSDGRLHLSTLLWSWFVTLYQLQRHTDVTVLQRTSTTCRRELNTEWISTLR
jgi:hypothetical protein